MIRLRDGIRTTGIVCLLFFLGTGTASVVGILLEPPPNARISPTYLAIGFGCFWGAMSGLAIWMLLAYWKGRVILCDDSLTQRGVFRTKKTQLDEIERINWKHANSKICLHTQASRLQIELLNFDVEDQLWLIRFMHDLPTPIHEGWEMFCGKVVAPLRQQSEFANGKTLPRGKVALTRKRWAWYFLPTTILFTIVGVILAWTLQKPQMFVAPLPILSLWAYLHFSTPKHGLATSRIGRSRFH